jgi:beta-lactamase regulating signal transducer with metallopeptidase domain
MPPEIVHASSNFLVRIAEPAARSLVLGCFAAAALGAFRVKSVSAKLFVWRGVLLAALAMPLLGWVAPSIRVPVPAPAFVKLGAAVASDVSENNVYDRKAATQPAAPLAAPVKTALLTARARHNAPIERPKYSMVTAPPELRNVPVRTPREIAWPVIAAAFYALIALFFFARLLVGMRLGKRLERAAKPIEDAGALAIVEAASRAAGLSVVPRLAESEMLSVPVTLGLRDSVILFPTEWRDWDPGELEAVLAHEISHVARRDALVQRLALIHRAVFWFSPLAWWLDLHLADLSEQASDEAALESGADRTRYAETLLGFFATLEAAPQRVWWQGVSMAKAGQAEKRVDRILAWRGAMSNRLKRSLVVGLVAVAAPVVVLTASVHPAINNFQEPVAATPVPPQSAAPPAQPTPPTRGVVAPGPMPSAPAATPEAPTPPPAADIGYLAPVGDGPSAAPIAAIAPTAPVAGFAPVAPVVWGPQDGPPGFARYSPEDLSRLRKEVQDARESLNKLKAQMAAAKAELSSSATKAQLDEAQRAMATYKAAQGNYAAALHEYNELLWQEKQEAHESGRTSYTGHFMGRYDDWGPRFVIVTKGSEGVTMSGSEEDAEHAKSLKSKIQGDFIWFERDEKSYIIRDQATVDRAKEFWEPEEALGKKQEALGKQQELLGEQQEALGKKMEEVRVKIPDMTGDLQALAAKMKELSANGGTQEEIGELQSQIGELQSKIGEVQSDAGRKQGEVGREQGELGRKQGELGRQQGELGRQQGELSRQATRQMKELLDEAVSKGLAQPE